MMSNLKKDFLQLKTYFRIIRSHCTLNGNVKALLNPSFRNEGGESNVISIGKDSKLIDCQFFFLGKNNKIEVGDNVNFYNVCFWLEGNGNSITIGHNTTIENATQLAVCEGTKIEIGADCMLSHSILIRTTDSHSIVNSIGHRINRSEDILIGNHVWIGLNSVVLKGTIIPDNCVIGACSLLTSSQRYEQNSVLVGIPARCIKKDITWLRELI